MQDFAPTRFSNSLNGRIQNRAAVERTSCFVRLYPAEGIGEFIQLGDPMLLIGRDPSSSLELADDSVSRSHATLECLDGEFVLSDLGSTNGTYVNERRIDSQRLCPGDRVRFGNQIFKFLSADRIEADYYETVYGMMITDGLTQAYSKRYLMDVIERELHRTHRTRRPLSVLMLDVDRFKEINDTHGHMTGDEVLVEICRRAKTQLRSDEVFARCGGEEFALVMSDTPLSAAHEVAERLRQTIADHPVHTEQGEIRVTVSIGIARTHGEERATACEFLHRVDQQLYAAKQSGRNRVMS
ncbi:MAG TPA: GGDEF domain-containing protein [Pirellulales bacterium]|jgi:diguanylate cyclase (GGDEF)-like protein|nr:GGDEF domain-containing protein [Pirellulales bacterium]